MPNPIAVVVCVLVGWIFDPGHLMPTAPRLKLRAWGQEEGAVDVGMSIIGDDPGVAPSDESHHVGLSSIIELVGSSNLLIQTRQKLIPLLTPVFFPRDILCFLAGNASSEEMDGLGGTIFPQKEEGFITMLGSMVEINSLDTGVAASQKGERSHRVNAAANSYGGEMLSLSKKMDHSSTGRVSGSNEAQGQV